MSGTRDERGLSEAARQLGDTEGLDLLAALVSIAPTNLEDPIRQRYEKPNYRRAAERIVRTARSFGLATQVYDPVVHDPAAAHLRGIARPNVIIDLEGPSPERVLILAHYDVVPVPAEQLGRWRSPPHTLTLRDDGRLYGRGANDDLGSGVVASLVAMRRLVEAGDARRSVRLLVCCDEETGGEGGVESLKEHDDRLPIGDPGRFLLGDVALIPDGSPHTTAGSSGVAFLDAATTTAAPLARTVSFGEILVGLDELARTWKSRYASPDWPDHGAPEPVLTGRASVTKLDLVSTGPTGTLRTVHAEADAANQIAESVTLVLGGPPAEVDRVRQALESEVRPPYRVANAEATSLEVPAGAQAFQVVGTSTHGGYPHRGHNPVPETIRLLRRGVESGWLDGSSTFTATYAVDLRLTPEMALASGTAPALARVEAALGAAHVPGRIEAPPARCRPGYALAPDHPALRRLAALLQAEGGEGGVFGEYGGTDASTLGTVATPRGEPLPAIVFGSMDRDSRIHDAEESADPRLLGTVARAVYRFIQEP